MTSPGPLSAGAPSQGRNSLLTNSSPVSSQNKWPQHDNYNISPHAVTTKHTMGQSYLADHTTHKIQAYPVGGGTSREQPVERSPFAGNITGDTFISNQETHSLWHPFRRNSVHTPDDILPVSGKGVIASLTAGCPSFPRRPPTPPPRVPFPRSPNEDSVFTYSPAPTDQVEWEQYYYYPNDTESVTPGHDMNDSYFETHSSPSLGQRRQRRSEYEDTHPAPPSARPASMKDTPREFYLQQPPRAAVGPKRESYRRQSPISTAASGREAYKQTSPISDQEDLQTAAARSHLRHVASPSTRLRPGSRREEAVNSPRKEMSPLANLPPGQPSPQNRKGHLSLTDTTAQGNIPAAGGTFDGTRRRVPVDYNQIYGMHPRTPEPNPYMPEYADPESGDKKKQRIAYASLSELDDSKLYSQLRNVPTPPKNAEFEALNEKHRKRKGKCCSVLNAHTYRDKEGHLITTSSPQISTTRFGLVSVSPIKNTDTSSSYYDSSQSSSLFGDTGNSLSESSRLDRFERAYVDGPLENSPLRKGFKAIDYSKIPPPDFSKIMSQYKHPAPENRIDSVKTLSGRSYPEFIKRKDLVVVMFHNSATDQPGTTDIFSKHSLKAPSSVTPEFATVDCAREQNLCATEGISSTPFFKMYSSGYLVNAVKEFGMLNY